MPKQIFQRPTPVRHENFKKGGGAGGAPNFGRKPPVVPKAAKPLVEKKSEPPKE